MWLLKYIAHGLVDLLKDCMQEAVIRVVMITLIIGLFFVVFRFSLGMFGTFAVTFVALLLAYFTLKYAERAIDSIRLSRKPKNDATPGATDPPD